MDLYFHYTYSVQTSGKFDTYGKNYNLKQMFHLGTEGAFQIMARVAEIVRIQRKELKQRSRNQLQFVK